MKKDLKIGLLYLNETNLGDKIIYDNTKMLIEKIGNEENLNITFLDLDVGENTPKNYILTKEENKNFKKYKEQEQKYKDDKNSKKYYDAKWKSTYNYYYLNSIIFPKITKDLDLLIFVGGGIIKYTNQNFHYIIESIIEQAKKNKIPVIFNSVGIEGYDDNDYKCKCLKKAINEKNVLSISTRDDLETLKNKYIKNKNIKVCKVSDPALSSLECYNIKNSKKEYIGVGVIRPAIFKEYSNKISEEDILNLYKDIINKLLDNKMKIKVFGNGTVADDNFKKKLQEHLSDEKYQDIFTERFTNSKDLVEFISKCRATIVARLHASIISYALNIPSIGLVWNNKQLMFGKAIGNEKAFITKENFNADYIYNILLELLENPPTIDKEYINSDYIFLKDEILEIVKNSK